MPGVQWDLQRKEFIYRWRHRYYWILTAQLSFCLLVIMSEYFYFSQKVKAPNSVTWKNRQMSIKVASKWFHYKNDRFEQLYKNCLRMLRDLGKLIVAKGFKKLPRVQKIARSGHTGPQTTLPLKLMHEVFKCQIKSNCNFRWLSFSAQSSFQNLQPSGSDQTCRVLEFCDLSRDEEIGR